MNPNRRSPASARRKAEIAIRDEELATPPSRPKQLIDSKTTRATPCPLDPPDAEESLP